MADEILLNEAAYAVWEVVKERDPIELGEVVKRTGIDQAQVSAAATEAVSRGYFAIREEQKDELIVSEGAKQLYDSGLPEILADAKLRDSGGELPMPQFVEWAKRKSVAVNDVLKWGAARNWIERKKDESGLKVALTAERRNDPNSPCYDLAQL